MAGGKKGSVPELQVGDMNRILNNVFAACQVEPIDVPLESVVAYTKYRQERFTIQKTISLIAFILFLMVPALFIAPKFSLSDNTAEDNDGKVQAYINVENWWPVKTITAEMNGYNLTVYEGEGEGHVYNVQPTENGTMNVRVTLFNGQYNDDSIEIVGVDNTSPVLISNYNDNDNLYLTVSDGDGLGINYEAVRGVAPDGDTVFPIKYNTQTGEIVFAYPEKNMNIIIPDMAGNKLQLVISLPS